MRLFPAPALVIVGFGWLDPPGAGRSFFPLPKDGLRLQPVHQIISRFERSATMPRGGASKDDRLARPHLAAPVNDADVADVEALGRSHGNVLERSPGERWMMFENEFLDLIAIV